MIQKKATLMAISLPIHLSTNYLTTGFARCAALPKICLRRFRTAFLMSIRVRESCAGYPSAFYAKSILTLFRERRGHSINSDVT